jgi:hypothetical protein
MNVLRTGAEDRQQIPRELYAEASLPGFGCRTMRLGQMGGATVLGDAVEDQSLQPTWRQLKSACGGFC